MNLDDLADSLHKTAVEKGFWEPLDRMDKQDNFVFYAKQLAMIHSEVTEVLEALRKSMGRHAVVEELADIIIRVLDLYAGLKESGEIVDSLQFVLEQKANINKNRPKMHGVAG